MIEPDDRKFTVHVYVRNDDDSFNRHTYNNYLEAANELRGENIIFMIAEGMALDAEVTYEQPSKPYNRSIWWRRSKDKVFADADEFLAHLDKLSDSYE
jgi:hypothetical protein